jgi:hypothetical protein
MPIELLVSPGLTNLAGEVIIEILSEHHARGEPVADAGGSLAARCIDASLTVNPVADRATDFDVLRKTANDAQRSTGQAFQTHNQK